ncbi:putative glycolipid-binding domain-containing protein [Solwaraspora sp. WMMD406]|uniref:putative glycolipid-binding domain-containing protein n=1 Tax=Solwaraspora sp. WMMD406 TaxID=3016095 RepID=UPI002418002C|nr:putative glycolipid-binding domain-containing protein [Solwaraspora sp. WMMD406]MDG4763258.1 putative glycolipid-binding domain-containing protein [Solwaraspora sp. WMMD406]
MPTMPKSVIWVRTDTGGADHALVDDRRGLNARGVAVAATPLPYTCQYELTTDEDWTAVRLTVTTEGAGWLRTVRMERALGRWRVSTAEQGDLDRALRAVGQRPVGLPGTEEPGRLDAALDVDLGAAPLFNTLPIRRLKLAGRPPGEEHRITVAWVRVPGLEVLAAEQIYTTAGPDRVGYRSGSFATELTVDPDGYVTHYPGLAERG